MVLVKSNHCAYDTHYHIVFPVKYRKSLLQENIVRSIKSIAIEIGERYDLEIEELGCDYNLIHLLCSFHPKYGGGHVVRLFKSIIARELFKKYPALKKDLWGGEFWSDGYYLATVSDRGNWNVVENYIKNQGKTIKEVELRLL